MDWDWHYLTFCWQYGEWDGGHGTLSSLADDTQLCGAVDMLEGRDSILERHLDRLERGDHAGCMMFNMAMCKVLRVGHDNPKHKYWVKKGLGAALGKGSWGWSQDHRMV